MVWVFAEARESDDGIFERETKREEGHEQREGII